MFNKIAVFYNPHAGRNKTSRMDHALNQLLKNGHELKRVETQPFKEDGELNRDYIEAIKGQDALLIVGGDGSIANVLNGLGEHLNIPFGVLPLGTINLLAREMKLNEHNFALPFQKGITQNVHLGTVNDRLFCITASLGIDASAVANVDLSLKKKIGRLAYVLSLFKALKTCANDEFIVQLHGQSHQAKGVIVMNGQYYAGSHQLGRDTSLLKRGFEIYLLKKNNFFALCKYGLAMLFSRLHQCRDVECFKNEDFTVTSLKNAHIQIDGDVGASTPAHFKSFTRTYKIVADL